MSSRYQHHRTSVVGKVPAATDINPGELVINTNAGRLYMKTDAGTVVTVNPDSTVYKSNSAAAPTIYLNATTAHWTAVGTTDSNGRIVFYMTANGASGGQALFSSILSVVATGVASGTSNANQYPVFVVESFTATTVTVRALISQTLLALGNTLGFATAGITCHVHVVGVY